jgi:conserved hypothetical protein YidD
MLWELDDIKMLKAVFIFFIKIYQRFISPLKPMNTCKFVPTCSQYAIQAIQTHGAIKGSILAMRRIGRCRPRSNYRGYDPIPNLGHWHSDIDCRINKNK